MFDLFVLCSRPLGYFECFSYLCWVADLWVILSVSVVCAG